MRHNPSLTWMPGDLAVRPFNYSVPEGQIFLSDFLLLRNEIGRILCWGMLEERRWTCLKSQ